MTAPAIKQFPPLQSGDRLSMEDFERRYFAMPRVKKAELIEGEVLMGSPVHFIHHGRPHAALQGWMFHYEVATPGVAVGDNSSFRLDRKNQFQPDIALCILPDYGGRTRMGKKSIMDGSPELVAEVAASSVSVDANRKLEVYLRNQVLEYMVWRTYDAELDWFSLRGGEYVPLPADPADGLLKSAVFPGLWLDCGALLKGDMTAVLAALNRGTASPEHAAFVQHLAARRTP